MTFMDVGGLPAVFQSSGRDDRDRDSMGYWWIFALVIIFFALVFWGRRDERSPLSDVAALNAVNNTRPAEAAFVEINGRLDGLTQQIGHINDVNDLRDLKSTQCEINQNILGQSSMLSTQIAMNRTDTLLNFKDLALQTANCCCDQLRAIDGVKFQQAQDTCSIINNQVTQTQRVLDEMRIVERDRLRDELAAERLAHSQTRQNLFFEHQGDRIISKLTPPCAVPSYPAWPAAQPVNPVVYNGLGFYPEAHTAVC